MFPNHPKTLILAASGMGFVGKITLDADTFRALASSTRLTVLKSLDERRKTLTELSRDLDLNKATVHEHMALLTAAGLVKKRDDEGRKWIYYELTWTGQRILHPEATTTFNLLLALSVAAAGGGVAMLGRALGWWMQDTISSRQSDGADTGLETADELGIMADDADRAAPEAASAPASDSGTATSDGSSPPSSQGQTQTGASSDTGAPSAAGGQSDTTVNEMAAPEDDTFQLYDGTDLDGGGAGPSFFDEGGWIGLALLLTCALFLGLALVLQRKFVPKPLDESAARAAESGNGSGGMPPSPPGSS